VSALDMSIQAQVIELLRTLQQQLTLTYLFIAHGLRLVQSLCTRTAVMYRGKIVETGSSDRIFANPQHPYTRALLSAVPVSDPDVPRHRIELDAATFDLAAPLREIAPSHFAAL
jgi:ABC-type oligopeptide transport system ATPase subunit